MLHHVLILTQMTYRGPLASATDLLVYVVTSVRYGAILRAKCQGWQSSQCSRVCEALPHLGQLTSTPSDACMNTIHCFYLYLQAPY